MFLINVNFVLIIVKGLAVHVFAKKFWTFNFGTLTCSWEIA